MSYARVRSVVGWLMLLVGIAVFAIRLQHPGPYDVPEGGNLLAAVLSLLLGIWLIGQWLEGHRVGGLLNVVALGGALPVLFFTLYAVLAEVEEVVVLRAPDRDGVQQDLRLWVVDIEGVPWANMRQWKADEHGLDGAEVVLLRGGEEHCVETRVFADPDSANRIHHLRHEVYAVQRLATAIRMFGEDAAPDTVAVRLGPCEGRR